MEIERVVWHNTMDWVIKTDGAHYWYRAISQDDWHSGMPLGMNEHEAERLFDRALYPSD